MKIAVDTSYITCASSTVTLPEGKTWADVSAWYIKWDILHIKWVGCEEYKVFSLNSDSSDGIDWKRPCSIEIFAVGESGETDYRTDFAN